VKKQILIKLLINSLNSGSTDGFDVFADVPSASIPFGAHIDFSSIIPNYNLMIDSRDFDSRTIRTNQVRGNSLGSNIPANLLFNIADPYNPSNENIFSNQLIQGALYKVNNSSTNLIGVYDLKKMASEGSSIPLTITNGHCYDLNVYFAPRQSPTIENIVKNTNNTINLKINGLYGGETVSALYSTNLVDWTDASTNKTYVPVTFDNFGNQTSCTISNVQVPMIMPEGSAESRPAPAAFFRIKVE
jgi:hypothetical protein